MPFCIREQSKSCMQNISFRGRFVKNQFRIYIILINSYHWSSWIYQHLKLQHSLTFSSTNWPLLPTENTFIAGPPCKFYFSLQPETWYKWVRWKIGKKKHKNIPKKRNSFSTLPETENTKIFLNPRIFLFFAPKSLETFNAAYSIPPR